jgi:CubicO group peptidase (beta-lactamase class C family)
MKKSYSPPQLTAFDRVEGLTRRTVSVLIALSLALMPAFPRESNFQAVFPGDTWIVTSPEAVGLSRSSLDSLWGYTGGTGFVSRYGYQAYAWGDYTGRSDFASASKTFLSFFLFKAIEEGRLDNLDVKVNIFEPCLNTINAHLGYKDRNKTFRHMATQISNYGVTEAPGTAFNYNDWQTALLADTLLLKVYQSSYSMVDQQVLNPLLADILQMEDSPTLQPGPGRKQLSARDFVRFGLLFLHRGTWNGTRVLSSTHATMAVTDPLPNTLPQSTGIAADMCPGQRTWGSVDISGNQIDHGGSYSWLWWTNGINQSGQRLFPDAPPDTYGAFGHGGKRAMVVLPSLDLVVSWNDTHLDSWPKVNEALRRLVVAVTVTITPPPALMVARQRQCCQTNPQPSLHSLLHQRRRRQ